MNLFRTGLFELSSGRTSSYKIDCDVLGQGDLLALAELIRSLLTQPFGRVLGIPRGGLRLAEALTPLCAPGSDTLLLVDDVLTTGASMEKARAGLDDGRTQIQGAVLFARGPCPYWVKAVFQMPAALWDLSLTRRRNG